MTLDRAARRRTVAIIQARMTSTRLPGKVLADLGGEPMLARVVARVRAARRVDQVWVACTERPEDDPVVRWCEDRSIPVWRGSETDVLGRYLAAARAAGAEVVVRITADCPLLDPEVIDRVVLEVTSQRADYAANVLERSYPRGLDVEAFTIEALERMDRLGTSAASREHVTIPVRLEHPDAFTVRSIRADVDDSDLRWTVDTPEDLAFVRDMYRALALDHRIPPYRELVRWSRTHQNRIRRDEPGHTWDPSRESRPAATEKKP